MAWAGHTRHEVVEHLADDLESDDLTPRPPPVRGCNEMIVSSMPADSFVWKVMSAFR